MEKMRIGKIVNTHGLRGELKVKTSTDFIDERFEKGATVYVEENNKMVPLEVLKMRIHKGMVLATFKGLEDINLVEKWKGLDLYAEKEYELLDEGEYYVTDLVGCDVIENNDVIGKVSDVQLYPHHDVLVVEGKTRLLIPYVDAFIIDEDIEEKKIYVQLIEGFKNEN